MSKFPSVAFAKHATCSKCGIVFARPAADQFICEDCTLGQPIPLSAVDQKVHMLNDSVRVLRIELTAEQSKSLLWREAATRLGAENFILQKQLEREVVRSTELLLRRP